MAWEELGLSPKALRDIQEAAAGVDSLVRAELIDWRERERIMRFRFIPHLIDVIEAHHGVDKRMHEIEELISDDVIGIVFTPDDDGPNIRIVTVGSNDVRLSLMILLKHSVWNEIVVDESGVESLAELFNYVLIDVYEKYKLLDKEGKYAPFWAVDGS